MGRYEGGEVESLPRLFFRNRAAGALAVRKELSYHVKTLREFGFDMAGRKNTDGSIYDVAKASGVSIGTVSRVFNRRPDVAEATRSLVLDAAKRVNYMPRISRRRTNIGLFVQEIEKANQVGFISQTVSTLAKHMALNDTVLEFIPVDDVDHVYRNYIRGVIAVVFGGDYASLRSLKNIPVVFINNLVEGQGNIYSVASDHAEGARLATEHLIARGHRQIGFLEVMKDLWGSQERQRGYGEAFRKARLKVPENLMRFCAQRPTREVLQELLAEKITALLVCGEDLSLEVNQILTHELNVRIPDDLSLITYEVPLVSRLMSPPQTTVSQPWDDIGRTAIATILSLVQYPRSVPPSILLPNRLIERSSVKSL